MSSSESQYQPSLDNLTVLGFALMSPHLIALDTFTGDLYLVQEIPLNPDHRIQSASESAIRALPTVRIEEQGLECAICLDEFEVGGEAKEMTCKHKFHSGCVEKWLRVNGSCPVCRYKMPVEEEGGEETKSGGELGRGEERQRESRGREMRIRFVHGEMVIDWANL